jgi:hypothetical protein
MKICIGQTWKIQPNETYPNGWIGTIKDIMIDNISWEESLIFWDDNTHSKIKYIKEPEWIEIY